MLNVTVPSACVNRESSRNMSSSGDVRFPTPPLCTQHAATSHARGLPSHHRQHSRHSGSQPHAACLVAKQGARLLLFFMREEGAL